MEDYPNYYAVIPADVRYDINLNSNSKLLYGEISALSNKNGYCTATNEYFSKLYCVSSRTITDWIKSLEDLKYIESVIETKRYEDGTIKKIRKIYITHIEDSQHNHIEDSRQNHTEENCSYNITSKYNTTSKKEIYKERFKKPTLDEVKEYCKERSNNIDAESFIDFYEANGWVQGKNKPIKDWKACIRTWEKNKKNNKTTNEVLPEWFNKDLNKKEEKKEDNLTDEQKDRIKRILANSGK